MFFSYLPGVRAAVLVSVAGYPESEKPPGMSFPVTAELEQRVQSHDGGLSTLSLKDFGPLRKLLLTGSTQSDYDAWLIPSPKDPTGRSKTQLLGVLVLMKGNDESDVARASDTEATIRELLRVSGQHYGEAIRGTPRPFP